MVSFRQAVNSFSAHSEHVLDLPGYIPGISMVSAAVRMRLATYQLITAVAMLALYGIGLIPFLPSSWKSGQGKEEKFWGAKLVDLRLGARDCVVHAIANLVRSLIEAMPIVNVALLWYDLQKAELFQSDKRPKTSFFDRDLIDPSHEVPWLFVGRESQDQPSASGSQAVEPSSPVAGLPAASLPAAS